MTGLAGAGLAHHLEASMRPRLIAVDDASMLSSIATPPN